MCKVLVRYFCSLMSFVATLHLRCVWLDRWFKFLHYLALIFYIIEIMFIAQKCVIIILMTLKSSLYALKHKWSTFLLFAYIQSSSCYAWLSSLYTLLKFLNDLITIPLQIRRYLKSTKNGRFLNLSKCFETTKCSNVWLRVLLRKHLFTNKIVNLIFIYHYSEIFHQCL